jgi:hypothetical protein
VLVVIATKRMA